MPGYQPTLPPEGAYSQLERLFISEQPRFLWPTNQNSNFGILRKTLTDPLQDSLDDISELFLELFIATSVGYLGLWEEQVGLPRNPTLPITLRRANILSRMVKTPFTRTRRKEIVERYLGETLGIAPQLLPEGLALTASGVPLYSGVTGSVADLYFIVENIEQFLYTVYIVDTATPDENALFRDLLLFTPAGIEFQVVYYTPVAGRKYGDKTYGGDLYGGGTPGTPAPGALVTEYGDVDGSYGGDGNDLYGGD